MKRDVLKGSDKDLTINKAIKLLRDMKPIPAIIHVNSYDRKFYYCPSCKREFYQKTKFCDQCGQAIKWAGLIGGNESEGKNEPQ